MKLSLIYYSKNGHTKEMTEVIKNAMMSEENIEAEILIKKKCQNQTKRLYTSF